MIIVIAGNLLSLKIVLMMEYFADEIQWPYKVIMLFELLLCSIINAYTVFH